MNASNTVKLNFKMTGGDQITDVEIDLNKTVQELKQLLAEHEKSKACSPPLEATMKLIYKGKILKDVDLLSSHSLSDGHTLHIVRGASGTAPSTTSAPSATNNAGYPAPAAMQPTATPGQGNPLAAMMGGAGGLGGLGGLGGMGGMGGMNAQQMMQNPEQMQQMMQNPMVQQMMDNMMEDPAMMEMMMQSNPQLQQLMRDQPEVAQMMRDPNTMRQAMQMMRNPQLMQEAMRQNDRALGNLNAHPQGMAAMQQMHGMMGSLGQGQEIPGIQNAQQYQQNQNAQATSDAVPNPFASGGNAAGGNTAAAPGAGAGAGFGMNNPLLGGMGAGAGAGAGGLSSLFSAMAPQPAPDLTNEATNPIELTVKHGLNFSQEFKQRCNENMGIGELKLHIANRMGAGMRYDSVKITAEQANTEWTNEKLVKDFTTAAVVIKAERALPTAGAGAGGLPGMEGLMNNPELMRNLMGMGGGMGGAAGLGGMGGAGLGGAGMGGMGGAPAARTLTRQDIETHHAAELQQLKDMGFDDERAVHALIHSNGNVQMAMERLLG